MPNTAVNAGRAIPVKFRIAGGYGLGAIEEGYPKVQVVNCASGAAVDEIESTVTAGASAMEYQASTGTYTYVWKTEKAWAGSCRRLIVGLDDGSRHAADFKLR